MFSYSFCSVIDSFQALTTKHGADFRIKHCSVEPLIFREELIVCCSTVLVAVYLHCDAKIMYSKRRCAKWGFLCYQSTCLICLDPDCGENKCNFFSFSSQSKDVKLMRTVRDFHSLIHTLLTDPAIREKFYKVSTSPLQHTLQHLHLLMNFHALS